MKQALVVLAMLFAFGLHTGTVTAEQQSAADGVYAPDAPYFNPALKYAGSFDRKLLFVRRTPHDIWQRKPNLDRISYIKCQSALDRLAKEGNWYGLIKNDGSCGLIGMRGELPEWATGNWLNWVEQHIEKDQQQNQKP